MSVSVVASLQRQWYILDELTNFSHFYQKYLAKIYNKMVKFYNSTIDSIVYNSYNVPIWLITVVHFL